MKNFFYICANVINAVVSAKKKFNAVCRGNPQSLNPSKNDTTFREGFCIYRQLRFSPGLTAVGLLNPSNNSEVAFASLTENVLALFKLTSNDLHTRKGSRVAPPSREWIIGNRWLVKTKAEKSFYHSFINSNLNRLGVMQGLKGVLNLTTTLPPIV